MRRAVSPGLTLGLALGLLLAQGAVAASAHDVWIEVADPGASVGQRLDIHLRVGHGEDGEVPDFVARNDRLLRRLDAIGPGDGAAPRVIPGLHGVDPAGVFRPDAEGVWTVVYEGEPVVHRLEAGPFSAYLDEEGLGHVAEARRAAGMEDDPGVELYSRSLKALVRVGDRDGLRDRLVGLPVEIWLGGVEPSDGGWRIEGRIASTEASPDVLADVLVDVWRDGVVVDRVRTDDAGRFLLSLDGSCDRWTLTAVVAWPVDHPEADWRTVFTAMTFTAAPFTATTLDVDEGSMPERATEVP